MKKVTFGILIITFIMYIGLNFFSDEGTADISYNDYSLRNVYLNIMVCNKPQYDMVKKITGEKHNIQYLYKSEEDNKNFKYNNNAINNVSNMDLFMYSGNNYENWDMDFINNLDKSKVGIVNISRGIRTQNYRKDPDAVNPYLFVGVEEYKVALYNIKNAIQDQDPKNRDLYEDNYKVAVEYIDNNLSIYNPKKQLLSNYTFITLDDSTDYFLKNLDIKYSYVAYENLDQYISNNNVDVNNLIIIKDSRSQLNTDNYKTVILESYNPSKSFESMIIDNYKSIFSITLDSNNKE